jgi:hypothetical protein
VDELIEDMARAIGKELYGHCTPEDTPNTWAMATAAARAALAAIHARGDRVVPGVATQGMIQAIPYLPDRLDPDATLDTFTAMLSASPYALEKETK